MARKAIYPFRVFFRFTTWKYGRKPDYKFSSQYTSTTEKIYKCEVKLRDMKTHGESKTSFKDAKLMGIREFYRIYFPEIFEKLFSSKDILKNNINNKSSKSKSLSQTKSLQNPFSESCSSKAKKNINNYSNNNLHSYHPLNDLKKLLGKSSSRSNSKNRGKLNTSVRSSSPRKSRQGKNLDNLKNKNNICNSDSSVIVDLNLVSPQEVKNKNKKIKQRRIKEKRKENSSDCSNEKNSGLHFKNSFLNKNEKIMNNSKKDSEEEKMQIDEDHQLISEVSEKNLKRGLNKANEINILNTILMQDNYAGNTENIEGKNKNKTSKHNLSDFEKEQKLQSVYLESSLSSSNSVDMNDDSDYIYPSRKSLRVEKNNVKSTSNGNLDTNMINKNKINIKKSNQITELGYNLGKKFQSDGETINVNQLINQTCSDSENSFSKSFNRNPDCRLRESKATQPQTDFSQTQLPIVCNTINNSNTSITNVN